MKKTIYIIVLFTISNLLFSTKTFAYIDPGSGSILLQAIIAAIAGAGTTISAPDTLLWERFRPLDSVFYFRIVQGFVLQANTNHSTCKFSSYSLMAESRGRNRSQSKVSVQTMLFPHLERVG